MIFHLVLLTFKAYFCRVSFQQQNSYRTKVQDVSHKLRGIEFGQDRYRRRYWALPHCGGIFVEGMESAEVDKRETPPGSHDNLERCKSDMEHRTETMVTNNNGVKTEVDKDKRKMELISVPASNGGLSIKTNLKEDVKRELFAMEDMDKKSNLVNGNVEKMETDYMKKEAMVGGGDHKFSHGTGEHKLPHGDVMHSDSITSPSKKELRSPTMKLEDYPLFRMDNFKPGKKETEAEDLTKQVTEEVKLNNKAVNGFVKEDEIKKTLRESLQKRALNIKTQDGVNAFCGKQEVVSPTKVMKDTLTTMADGCEEKLAKYQAILKEGKESLSPESKMYACINAIRQIDLKSSPFKFDKSSSITSPTQRGSINSQPDFNSSKNTPSSVASTNAALIHPESVVSSNKQRSLSTELLISPIKTQASVGYDSLHSLDKGILPSEAQTVIDNIITTQISKDSASFSQNLTKQESSNDQHIKMGGVAMSTYSGSNSVDRTQTVSQPLSSHNTSEHSTPSVTKASPVLSSKVSILKPNITATNTAIATTTGGSISICSVSHASSDSLNTIIPMLNNSVVSQSASPLVGTPTTTAIFQGCFNTVYSTLTSPTPVHIPEGYNVLSGTWFSLLPKHSCDRSTVLHTSTSAHKAQCFAPPPDLEMKQEVNASGGGLDSTVAMIMKPVSTPEKVAMAMMTYEEFEQQQRALLDQQYCDPKPIPEGNYFQYNWVWLDCCLVFKS